MAEILCQYRTDLPAGSTWERGDPVVIAPDGWDWGTEERDPSKFFIVKVPGSTMQAVATSLGILPNFSLNLSGITSAPEDVAAGRRRGTKFDLTLITVPADGVVSMTKTQFQQRHKAK